METYAREDKDTQYAYRCLQDFFDCYQLSQALTETEKITRAAVKPKAWRTKRPYRPVLFMEQFSQLVHAAFCIMTNYSEREASIIKAPADGEPDLRQTQNYFSLYRNCSAWSNMPRHLTAAQYHDPYIVLRKFTSYAAEPEWKQVCKDFAEYALTNGRMDEEYPGYKLLPIRLHMLRLLEACHLILVRSARAKPTTGPAPAKKDKKQ